jgi:hypothetical protein
LKVYHRKKVSAETMPATTFTTERPFHVEITIRPVPMKLGETRLDYLKKARRCASRMLAKLREHPDYQCCHDSFAVRDAMLATEKAFPDIGTFGVEHIRAGHNRRSPAVEYLNSGDTYDLTLLHINGRFSVGCWGDIVERGSDIVERGSYE